jgi:dTDP-4-dehydrorhamnose reductase
MTQCPSPDFLVFGKSGQLARALAILGRSEGLSLLCVGRADANLAIRGDARTLIETIRPRYVINAAAFTAVDQAEDETALCDAVNAYAPGEMAEACGRLGIRFVHVSTDYVFNGETDAPYTETCKPDPINVYGQSKLGGELNALNECEQTAIVRTSAVFSGFGQDFPSKILNLSKTHPFLKVVDDQITGPTPAMALAQQLRVLAQGSSTGIFHCSGQPYVSWADFASAFLQAAPSPRSTQIIPIPSTDYPTRALRPKRSCLGGTRLKEATGLDAPQWQKSIAMMLDAWRSSH